MCSNHIISKLNYLFSMQVIENKKKLITLKTFLNYVYFKKKYIQFIHDKINAINLKNSNKLHTLLKIKNTEKVLYIVTIKYTPVNTLLYLTNSSGRALFYKSAGHFFKGKQKTARFLVLKKIINKLFLKFSFLQSFPLAVHFINVFNKNRIIKYIKKKIFISTIKSFNCFPHNGCRNKKIKRKKFKKKLRI